MLQLVARKKRLASVATITTEVINYFWKQPSAQELFVGSFVEWVSIAEQLLTSLDHHAQCQAPWVFQSWPAATEPGLSLDSNQDLLP